MFNKFEDRVQQPTYKHKIKIYSDGNDDYTFVLPGLKRIAKQRGNLENLIVGFYSLAGTPV